MRHTEQRGSGLLQFGHRVGYNRSTAPSAQTAQHKRSRPPPSGFELTLGFPSAGYGASIGLLQ